MANKYTVVTKQNYGSRLGNSIKGVVFGLILFIASFVVLWVNEGTSVKVQAGLKDARETTVILEKPTLDKGNNNKLVYVSGDAESKGEVIDSELGIGSKGLMLHRKVEMYQWKEEEHSTSSESVGGSEETTTEYTYKKVWSENLIDSSRFHMSQQYRNPNTMPMKTKSIVNPDSRLGDFKLSGSILGKIDRREGVPVSSFQSDAAPGTSIQGDHIYLSPGAVIPTPVQPQVADPGVDPTNMYGVDGSVPAEQLPVGDPVADSVNDLPGSSPVQSAPGQVDISQIGTTRISYTVVTDGPISVVAAQVGSSLSPYTTSNGTSIELAKEGSHTADTLFTEAENQNVLRTWIMRLVGFMLMWFGLMLILGPVSMLLAFLPILKNITGFIAGVFTFAIALILSLLTIAIAWLFYRPLLSLVLIAVVIAIAAVIKFFIIDKIKKKGGDDSNNTSGGVINSETTPNSPNNNQAVFNNTNPAVTQTPAPVQPFGTVATAPVVPANTMNNDIRDISTGAPIPVNQNFSQNSEAIQTQTAPPSPAGFETNPSVTPTPPVQPTPSTTVYLDFTQDSNTTPPAPTPEIDPIPSDSYSTPTSSVSTEAPQRSVSSTPRSIDYNRD